jgi:rod shape-determining protein MreD|tara:strand:+ start:177931 stop:178485 length:555 start_codon:yes stop_codon:yes gene_type:complete
MNLSSKNISSSLQLVAPYALLMLMFVLDNIYLSWSAVSEIRPGFTLMGIFYWAIYRPTLFPPLVIFIISLAMDITNGTALGLHCLVLLPVYLFVRRQRRFLHEQPFFVVWLGYVAVSCVVNAALWLLVRVSQYSFDLTLSPTTFTAILYDVAAGVFLFPVIATLLYVVHRMLPQTSWRASGDIK